MRKQQTRNVHYTHEPFFDIIFNYYSIRLVLIFQNANSSRKMMQIGAFVGKKKNGNYKISQVSNRFLSSFCSMQHEAYSSKSEQTEKKKLGCSVKNWSIHNIAIAIYTHMYVAPEKVLHISEDKEWIPVKTNYESFSGFTEENAYVLSNRWTYEWSNICMVCCGERMMLRMQFNTKSFQYVIRLNVCVRLVRLMCWCKNELVCIHAILKDVIMFAWRVFR